MGDKLLKKVQAGRSNVRIDEPLNLMESYGFEWKRTKHGYMFLHEKLKNVMLPHVPIPHDRENKILVRYIDMCLLAIDALLKGEQS